MDESVLAVTAAASQPTRRLPAPSLLPCRTAVGNKSPPMVEDVAPASTAMEKGDTAAEVGR